MSDNNKDKITELEEKNDKLAHELLDGKVRGVRAQVMALGDTLHGRIDDLEKKNDVQFQHLTKTLDEIKDTSNRTLDQAIKTNSRVTKIEAEKLPEKMKELEKQTRKLQLLLLLQHIFLLLKK